MIQTNNKTNNTTDATERKRAHLAFDAPDEAAAGEGAEDCAGEKAALVAATLGDELEEASPIGVPHPLQNFPETSSPQLLQLFPPEDEPDDPGVDLKGAAI